ncbi:unnamed protein product, partial [Brassica oleracea]
MSRGDYVALKAQQTQALGYVKVCIRRTIFFRRILGDVDDQYCLHCSSTCSFIIKNTQIFSNRETLCSHHLIKSSSKKYSKKKRHTFSFAMYSSKIPNPKDIPPHCLKTKATVNQALPEQVADGSSRLTNTL